MFSSRRKMEISSNRLGTDIQNAKHVVVSYTTLSRGTKNKVGSREWNKSLPGPGRCPVSLTMHVCVVLWSWTGIPSQVSSVWMPSTWWHCQAYARSCHGSGLPWNATRTAVRILSECSGSDNMKKPFGRVKEDGCDLLNQFHLEMNKVWSIILKLLLGMLVTSAVLRLQ